MTSAVAAAAVATTQEPEVEGEPHPATTEQDSNTTSTSTTTTTTSNSNAAAAAAAAALDEKDAKMTSSSPTSPPPPPPPSQDNEQQQLEEAAQSSTSSSTLQRVPLKKRHLLDTPKAKEGAATKTTRHETTKHLPKEDEKEEKETTAAPPPPPPPSRKDKTSRPEQEKVSRGGEEKTDESMQETDKDEEPPLKSKPVSAAQEKEEEDPSSTTPVVKENNINEDKEMKATNCNSNSEKEDLPQQQQHNGGGGDDVDSPWKNDKERVEKHASNTSTRRVTADAVTTVEDKSPEDIGGKDDDAPNEMEEKASLPKQEDDEQAEKEEDKSPPNQNNEEEPEVKEMDNDSPTRAIVEKQNVKDDAVDEMEEEQNDEHNEEESFDGAVVVKEKDKTEDEENASDTKTKQKEGIEEEVVENKDTKEKEETSLVKKKKGDVPKNLSAKKKAKRPPDAWATLSADSSSGRDDVKKPKKTKKRKEKSPFPEDLTKGSKKIRHNEKQQVVDVKNKKQQEDIGAKDATKKGDSDSIHSGDYDYEEDVQDDHHKDDEDNEEEHNDNVAETGAKRGALATVRRLPRPQDVLMGKGKPVVMHPGNKRFRRIVLERFSDYDSQSGRWARPKERHLLVQQVARRVEKGGGEFLRFVGNQGNAKIKAHSESDLALPLWQVIQDRNVIYRKIKQLFRQFRVQRVKEIVPSPPPWRPQQQRQGSRPSDADSNEEPSSRGAIQGAGTGRRTSASSRDEISAVAATVRNGQESLGLGSQGQALLQSHLFPRDSTLAEQASSSATDPYGRLAAAAKEQYAGHLASLGDIGNPGANQHAPVSLMYLPPGSSFGQQSSSGLQLVNGHGAAFSNMSFNPNLQQQQHLRTAMYMPGRGIQPIQQQHSHQPNSLFVITKTNPDGRTSTTTSTTPPTQQQSQQQQQRFWTQGYGTRGGNPADLHNYFASRPSAEAFSAMSHRFYNPSGPVGFLQQSSGQQTMSFLQQQQGGGGRGPGGQPQTPQDAVESLVALSGARSPLERLEDLERLRGILSSEEYQVKRNQILRTLR